MKTSGSAIPCKYVLTSSTFPILLSGNKLGGGGGGGWVGAGGTWEK